MLADTSAATILTCVALPIMLADTATLAFFASGPPTVVYTYAAAAAFLALFAPPAMGTGRGYDDRSNRVSGCPS